MEKEGYNVKAAIPLTNEYVSDCISAFDNKTMSINYRELMNASLPIDFNQEDKTDYLVLRLSCIFLNKNHSIGVIHRSSEDHAQNPSMNSVLLSSELIEYYGFVKLSGSLLINPHYPFTDKLGAYLGAFNLGPDPWLTCLRRQKDHRNKRKYRYYAFYVYKAELKNKYEDHSLRFDLRGNVSHDKFKGFWPLEEVLNNKLPQDDRLPVDHLILKQLISDKKSYGVGTHNHPDIYCSPID